MRGGSAPPAPPPRAGWRPAGYRQRRSTAGAAGPRRFTTMREEAHITFRAERFFERMPAQALRDLAARPALLVHLRKPASGATGVGQHRRQVGQKKEPRIALAGVLHLVSSGGRRDAARPPAQQRPSRAGREQPLDAQGTQLRAAAFPARGPARRNDRARRGWSAGPPCRAQRRGRPGALLAQGRHGVGQHQRVQPARQHQRQHYLHQFRGS